VGIRIHEGYGLTETSPVISVNTPAAHRIGSVGKPLSNVQVRIAEDGEILAKAPSVFQAYWNNPQETQAAFLDGWFKTGDIGALDKDGYLYVTDRKKDLIKTSGGKFIAPQPIENALKQTEVPCRIDLSKLRRFGGNGRGQGNTVRIACGTGWAYAGPVSLRGDCRGSEPSLGTV
jgi:long-subunit acyl-CoA synthetase (AMP-forming)